MEKLTECPKCGCDSYSYKQLEESHYVGTFGEAPMGADTVVKRANKTIQCEGCGYRIAKEKVMGDRKMVEL